METYWVRAFRPATSAGYESKCPGLNVTRELEEDEEEDDDDDEEEEEDEGAGRIMELEGAGKEKPEVTDDVIAVVAQALAATAEAGA